MFRKNTSHQQPSLFGLPAELFGQAGIASQLSQAKLKKLKNSKEYDFYRLVFCKIKEQDFAVLYSDAFSRPNAPVNSLVASIILMYHHGWTTAQLFDRIDFDLLTRTALGLPAELFGQAGLDETPFCPATFFNFQNRLLSHFILPAELFGQAGRAGENLLEWVFDNLTQEQLETLKVKTNIQRCDSFMAMSNIRSYSRTQLLVEMLIRLHRSLIDQDKERFNDVMAPYIKQSSGQYLYKLERSQIPHEPEKLGQLYHMLYEALKDSYRGVEIFDIFERVYNEHFTVVEDKVQVRASKELNGSSLQSPDDIDATYRQKNGQHYRGQTVNVIETANPENDVNLITDVAVCSNDTDDSQILNQRIEQLKDKTPQLEELHTDGAYGSEDNDKKMEQLEITHVQTAVRGRKAAVAMEIEQTTDGKFSVGCPKQCASSQETKKRYKACFDVEICKRCPLSEGCPAKEQGQQWVYYFDRSDYLRGRRSRDIESLPPERRKLRPNVEATVKEFTGPLNHKGKLKVRGLFKTMLYAYSMAVSINFGRVWRYLAEKADLFAPLRSIWVFLIRLLGEHSGIGLRQVIIRPKISHCGCTRRYFARAA